MIPPSINLIIYGFLTESSIPQLFLAGLVPGFLLAVVFMTVTGVLCWRYPGLGGPARRSSRREKLAGLVHLVPILVLFGVIVGSIYAGVATPTEAAALGVAIALIIAAVNRGLSLSMLGVCLRGTVRVTAMIMLVVLGASFLNFTLTAAGLGSALQGALGNLGLGALGSLLVIVALYLVLGFFIETLSLMVATIPIVAPVVFGLGYDKIWFGVLLILLVEMALITPPVGLNLFVVQGARRSGRLSEVMVGAIPYVVAMLAMAALLIAVPGLALWLPGYL